MKEMNFKETEAIECPVCNYIQEEGIYDLVETSDMDGEFNVVCEKCTEEFKVEFKFVPLIKTSK